MIFVNGGSTSESFFDENEGVNGRGIDKEIKISRIEDKSTRWKSDFEVVNSNVLKERVVSANDVKFGNSA